MQKDNSEISEFYKGSLGQIAKTAIISNIKRVWQNQDNQDILGYGYTSFLLDEIKINSRRTISLNFADYESDNWPKNAKINTVISEQELTPFKEASFDKIICIHAIEEAQNPIRMLRELWRILTPEGSIILVVPNRRGFWAQFESIPFGNGRPYTKTQLSKLLSDSMFTIKSEARILYTPPLEFLNKEPLMRNIEKTGKIIFPTFGGLLFFEIAKRVMIRPDIKDAMPAIAPAKVNANFLRTNQNIKPNFSAQEIDDR